MKEKTTSTSPMVFCPLSPAKPTPVYDTYWRFAAERQAVFFRRFELCPFPWTTDRILQEYKFTNAYRASDRVSQYLIKNVIYRSRSKSAQEVFFRVILFKTFNKIETWEFLEGKLGEISTDTFLVSRYDSLLTALSARKVPIYSNAYIMPSGGAGKKHRKHLSLIQSMLEDHVGEKISSAPSMSRAFDILRCYPTIGDFLAYQYVTDLNYSTITNFSERDFVVPGPGARDGIRKCFRDLGGLTEPELIKFVMDRQEEEFRRLDLDFQSLWGRRLHLIDCQNLFCEVDKYSRVAHPEVKGQSGRTRIKQRYRPSPEPLIYWYPPKWGLNGRIDKELRKNVTAQNDCDIPT